jgi:hypothetical protein
LHAEKNHVQALFAPQMGAAAGIFCEHNGAVNRFAKRPMTAFIFGLPD